MNKLMLICPLLLLLMGCSNKEDASPQIGGYASHYMVHDERGAYYTPFKGFSFEHENGKVIKRTGGPACILSASCQNDPTIIDEITYENNAIRIVNRSGNEQGIVQEEWLFGLKDTQQPTHLIHKADNRSLYDSLAYAYYPNGQIYRIVVYSVYRDEKEVAANRQLTKDFLFDTSGNLNKVETRHLLDDGFVIRMTVEEFSDYDAANNPFKGLFMFGDTYYRSLSKNNFRKYRREEIDMQSGNVVRSQGKDWVLEYDTSGRPLFDKL